MIYTKTPQGFDAQQHDDRFRAALAVPFGSAMARTSMAISLADPALDDVPLVFVNSAFLHLTGYSKDEVLGRNCRFLQGPDTDPDQVARLRDAIAREDVVAAELLNYRKDGTAFWNALHMGPIYDDDGDLLYYFGSQWDVSNVHAARTDKQHARTLARELSHRIKNVFAVIAGLITVAGRVNGFRKEAAEINDRIRALGRAFETTLDDASLGSVQLGSSIRSVMEPYDGDRGRIVFEGAEFRVSPNVVSTVGLALHELATNAISYGALGPGGGSVHLGWSRDTDRGALILDWRESGGPAVEPPTGGGSGLEIIDSLLSVINGRLERDWHGDGFRARLTIPLAQ